MSRLFCIRHGEGWHNVNFGLFGRKAYYDKEGMDPNLTEKGIKQAKDLGVQWKEKNDIELIITSPLTRCIETTKNIFGPVTNIPIISVDFVREYPASLQYSNRRKNRKVLEEKYKDIKFVNLIGNEDILWDNNNKYETLEQLNYRTKKFENFVLNLKEKNIALVSHSTFLMNFLFNTVDENEDKELKHCYVYHKNYEKNLFENA